MTIKASQRMASELLRLLEMMLIAEKLRIQSLIWSESSKAKQVWKTQKCTVTAQRNSL